MTSPSEKRAAFRALHNEGCFVIPNPWDGRTAQQMETAGFKALASTSAGAAWALGKEDGAMTLEEALVHLRFLCGLTNLPVNADFEAGFADTPDGVAANVARAIVTGIAGVSIEDQDDGKLFAMEEAVARLKGARAAIDAANSGVLLVGRCEAYLPIELPEVIARLQAYEAAGADVLYAPGLKTLDQIAQVVKSVGRPVNANLTGTGLSVADMASVGVRRVSVGAALARSAYEAAEGFIAKLANEGRLP